jgi:hypothetical protein
MRKQRKAKNVLPLILFIIVASSTGAVAADKPTTFTSVDAGIKALKIAPDVRANYSRSNFKHWSDLDKNGCNTRNDVILQEALAKPKVDAGCKIVKDTGKWYSVYDGLNVTNFSGLDVDHFVPLAEAWDSGANKWDAAKREVYANDMGDPISLIAVTAASNRSKSDQDPGEWLPPLASYHCAYVKQWVQVKIRWSLTVDEKELKVLKDVNAKCPKSKISVVIVK